MHIVPDLASLLRPCMHGHDTAVYGHTVQPLSHKADHTVHMASYNARAYDHMPYFL
jgi:hypothetical protein